MNCQAAGSAYWFGQAKDGRDHGTTFNGQWTPRTRGPPDGGGSDEAEDNGEKIVEVGRGAGKRTVIYEYKDAGCIRVCSLSSNESPPRGRSRLTGEIEKGGGGEKNSHACGTGTVHVFPSSECVWVCVWGERPLSALPPVCQRTRPQPRRGGVA